MTWDLGGPYCDICGAPMEMESCWYCLGDGGFDLYEQNPIEYGPGDYETCDVCHGDGEYLICSALPHKEQTCSSS